MRLSLAGKIMRRRRFCPWCPVAVALASWAARTMNAKASTTRQARRRYADVAAWANARAVAGVAGFRTVAA